MPFIILVLGFLQTALGVLGFVGVASYLAEAATNPSRYQFLLLPLWCFLFAVPLLIVSALLYRKAAAQITRLQRWCFTAACVLPICSFATAIAANLLT
jgi:hypothetical protein